MKIISSKRCIIGEGPIWNEKDEAVYYTNGYGKEILKYNFYKDSLETISLQEDVAAIAFDKNNNLIVSQNDGVFILNKDGTKKDIYDTKKYKIRYGNDMKIGPDGCIYVGTQSSLRMGITNETDGKLYRIDKNGNVKILLDNMHLSNGMDWSEDEKYFYHTDSDTGIIKEYLFDKENGDISFTGRQSDVVSGVDGFTIGKDNNLYIACWGMGCIAVLDLCLMTVKDYIKLPCRIPTSCCFAGKNIDKLFITTASYREDIDKDRNAGFVIIADVHTEGRKPYIFG